MAKFAYFDCFSGISGDMTLGALIDLGLDVQEIESAIRSMGLPEISITREDVKKHGFRAVQVHIEHPPEHAHRHLHHITEMIDSSAEIESPAKDLAKRIFGHVAVAEAHVHGTSLEKVHFHEVGAIDSIADIVGVAVGITRLEITSATSAPVPTGTGMITIAHGNVSVPAPATAEILRGIPLAPNTIAAELTTPTGAAILRELASEFGPVPPMAIDRIGYGAGTMDLREQANMLRILLGTRTDPVSVTEASENAVHHDHVVLLETNLDDATGEEIADATERLFNAGALDVTQTPCTMKKGRPGVVVAVMARPDAANRLENLLFECTPTIGIRRSVMHRGVLPRESIQVETRYGVVKAKMVTLPGGAHRIKPEDDEVRRLSQEFGLPSAEIRHQVVSAWNE
ncbi:MAG: nickel pincer cofactor biosynthesis protein LarC, partial [Planctomycetota bacterium]